MLCRWAMVALCLATVLGATGCGDRRRGPPSGSDAGPGTVDGGGGDAGTSDDAGPMRDAGDGRDAGESDAGPPGRDAGPPGRDAGPAPRDAGAAAVNIPNIQRGIIPAGTHVVLRGVVVTAVYSRGVWVQDPTAGAMYSGIRVFTSSAPTVARDDRVDVEGDVLEYFDDTEIDSAVITSRGRATPIAPARLRVAQAATEPYEGVLVQLTDISSFVSPYDCVVDNPACTDTGLWQVNGTTGILVYDFTYENTDWTTHVRTSPVAGVMTWRFDRRRIMPRTRADFGP